ncbi:MAG: asparagine synthetase B [Vicinamibacterales bacterium]
MSGIGVLVHRDDRLAAESDVAPIGARVSAARGGGPVRVRLDGPAALVLCAFETSPFDDPAPGPISDGRLSIAMDGHLYERDALGAALGLDPPDLARMSDAKLMLAAYARWGEDTFARLVGDFAVAIWDAPLRRLVCARDPMGARPLFYAVDGVRVRAASSLAALVEPDTGLNEGMIGEYLSGHPVHTSESVYQGILRLPPAHLLVADPRQSRVTRYWAPDGFRELRYRRDAEYEEHCRTLFDRVVADHLSVPEGQPGPGLMLSGGIDSGSILASAAAQRRTLSAFTIGYDDPAFDETRVAEAVVRHAGVTDWERVAPFTAFDPAAEARETLEIPSYPSGVVSATLRRRARARGIHVMLTGVGGDEWFFGSDWRGADMLARGRLLSFLHYWRAVLAMPDSIGTRGVWRNALWPLVPAAARDVARAVRRRRGAVPPWIAPGWARRIDLGERLSLRRARVAARSHAVRDHLLSLHDGAVVAAHDEQERFAARERLEDRQPFMDRRMAEFALSLPEEQRWRDGWPKSILLRAFRDRLPRETRCRREQPDYGFLVRDAVEQIGWRERLARSRLADAGWLDDAWAAGIGATPGPLTVDAANRIWSILAVELWLEGVSPT